MGNVNMEADQIHVRDNNHKTRRTVADALKALEASGEGVAEDITELYTRDASRASKDDIANEFDAETLYHTGDYVYYEGTLFKFIANHSGEWDLADVVVAQIGDDIATLNNDLTNLSEDVNGDATTYPYADVITIENAVPSNLADCSVKIEPVQSGSGDPSPENVRPITGHTEASVVVTDGDETTKTYTIALGDTIYGGTVDFDSGVMTVTKAIVDLGSLSWSLDANNRFVTEGIASTVKAPATQQIVPDAICSSYKVEKMAIQDNNQLAIGTTGKIFVKDSAYSDATSFTTAVDGEQLCYELATPATIQLTPQQIQLLKGTNTISASTGQISVTANGVSGAIGSVQEQVNATDAALAELAEKLPDAPTTDGAYVLTVTVADGMPTYSWVSGS